MSADEVPPGIQVKEKWGGYVVIASREVAIEMSPI